MKLYHGSSIEVPFPDILHSRSRVDFGKGFYLTPIYEQAERWSQRHKSLTGSGVVSVYDYNEASMKELKVLRFDSYSEEWLEFITACRSGKDASEHDIVIGGVANDRVFDTLELFFAGLIGAAEAIGRLKYHEVNSQLCFRTQTAIERCLRFERSVKV